MNKKEITIPCPGYEIAADWYEGDHNDILLVLMGFRSSKAHNADFVADIVARTRMDALVIDYSGHGESPFQLDETRPAQHLLEAIIAFDWLSAHYPTAKINVMGASYGGFLAAYVARFRPFHKLILRTPAIYPPSDFYSLYIGADMRPVRAYRGDSEAVAAHPLFLQETEFTGPTLLVVHGEDEIIPPATTDVFQKAFNADTYTAKGLKHALRDPANPRERVVEYCEVIAGWLKK
jgi:pimeloyl-ACP methyl ester carboxylesterase